MDKFNISIKSHSEDSSLFFLRFYNYYHIRCEVTVLGNAASLVTNKQNIFNVHATLETFSLTSLEIIHKGDIFNFTALNFACKSQIKIQH